MATNHLLIGLGGTGGRILRSFRKQVFQDFQGKDVPGVNLRFLYVDSNRQDLTEEASWKILGTSVQLSPNSLCSIAGMNLAGVLDNLDSYPGIKPWLGSRDLFRHIVGSAAMSDVVGGQKRRLGRFLFACQVNKFKEQVQNLVKEMENNNVAGVTFHICAGLAGGTGSGSLIDALCQIRASHPGVHYRILIYALLPERAPAGNRAKPNYHANGYAALTELNALDVGAWKPHDVSGGQGDKRLEIQDPFNCCYLFTDENEDHNKLDVDRELPEMAASFLYQKTVAIKDMANWTPLSMMESYENDPPNPELSQATQNAERSRKFFAFGIKQIAYPEEEIREYLTYTFARQAVLQLQFNYWMDSTGYADEPSNQAFGEFVASPEARERWRLTDEHLCLSLGILPTEINNPQWKPINQLWSGLLPNFKQLVRDTHRGDKRGWLDELEKLCGTAFDGNYRSLGVRKFYETKEKKDLPDQARELRRIVEADLFEDWRNGVRSMHDISRLLAALTADVDERAAAVDARLAKMKDSEAAAAAKVKRNADEWVHVGKVSEWWGKLDSLFDAQSICLEEVYIFRTRIEGLQYAKKLLQSLATELADLASQVSKAVSMILQAAKEFGDRIAERCNDGGKTELSTQVVRFYNPSDVKDFAKVLAKDKAEQQKQTSVVRARLSALLGETRTFANFNRRINKAAFNDTLEATCLQNAMDAHGSYLAANRDRPKILQVGVLERLYKEFSGNPEALRNYINNIVSRSKNYLCFNLNEVITKPPGFDKPALSMSELSIILPESNEFPEFRKELEQAFQGASERHKDVISTKRTNQITLVSLTNLFPVRFVADAAMLRDRYEARISGSEGEQARAELHLEGDGSKLPSLFIRKVTSDEIRPILLIAEALGIVKELEDPETGIKSYYLLAKNERGRDTPPVQLGRDFVATVEDGGLMLMDRIEGAVQPLLNNEYLHQAKRQELLEKIERLVNDVKAERKNPLDRTYKAYSLALERVEQRLGLKA